MFISWSQYYYFEFSCYQCITDYLSLSSLDCQDKYYMQKNTQVICWSLHHTLWVTTYNRCDCIPSRICGGGGGGRVLRPIE